LTNKDMAPEGMFGGLGKGGEGMKKISIEYVASDEKKAKEVICKLWGPRNGAEHRKLH